MAWTLEKVYESERMIDNVHNLFKKQAWCSILPCAQLFCELRGVIHAEGQEFVFWRCKCRAWSKHNDFKRDCPGQPGCWKALMCYLCSSEGRVRSVGKQKRILTLWLDDLLSTIPKQFNWYLPSSLCKMVRVSLLEMRPNRALQGLCREAFLPEISSSTNVVLSMSKLTLLRTSV